MPKTGEQAVDREPVGVLLGWKHTNFNGKLILQLQTTRSSGGLAEGRVENSHLVMTPQQATVLANYLLQVSGASPPPRRKQGKLKRWFGG